MVYLDSCKIAEIILAGFNRHFDIFSQYNRRAAIHFTHANWQAARIDARLQVDLYDQRVAECVTSLKQVLCTQTLNECLWQQVKYRYTQLLYTHQQPELAESFYNSVFCQVFNSRYYNNTYIFFRHAINTQHIECTLPDYRCYYPTQDTLQDTLRQCLHDTPLDLPFDNIERDAQYLTQALYQNLPSSIWQQHVQIHIASPLFYRNKGAYLIGRLIDHSTTVPIIMPLLQNKEGLLYVDALLHTENDVTNIFSFTRAYFKADFPVPSALVRFLQSILPHKSPAELYTALGFHKQGKNEFYRAFIYHLKHSNDLFIPAAGEKGMVMLVFTLPSYPYVFKIIKDHFHVNKTVTHSQVKARYHLVKQLDRGGRMADTWEFSQVAFPHARFTAELLDELQQHCAKNLLLTEEHLIIKHLYIEKRMTPLNLYICQQNKDEVTQAILEYGKAIEEIAAAGIFPGDLLLKNFGVTRYQRVVFYDYDEIMPLEECNFRHIPQTCHYEEELAAEPWYPVGDNDIFPEEFTQFLISNPELKQLFLQHFKHLTTADYWKHIQSALKDGAVLDVFPYSQNKRFNP